MRTKPLLFGKIKTGDLLWAMLLVIPALYINLDLLPLIGDEAIRALVSLEMMISGDYVTPTLNGELYFNKPPLYNWLLILFFKVFHSNSEIICRLPTTIFLILYCFTVFWWVRKRLGTQSGILAALMFLTCGRILFYDSFLGLIDIAYSWLVFLNFMLMWDYFIKREFLKLFVMSYVLTAVTFLLKGVPSLAFQVITLLTLFISTRNFRKLFSWQHITGIAVFILLASIYYYIYYLRHPSDIDTLLLRLISESTQKSALGTKIASTIWHIFTFPFDVLYHFIPWTLLVILIFNRKIMKRALSAGFIRYCILVFLANIIIYWLSPITYPRYLLMLFPLIFIVFLYLAKYHELTNTVNYRIVSQLLYGFMIALVISNALLPVVFARKLPVNQVFLKAFVLLAAGLLSLYLLSYSRKKTNTIFTLAVILLISRISFNLFLLPYRQSISWPELCRNDAIHLGRETKGQNLFFMTDTMIIPNAYYITRERNEILRFNNTLLKDTYYIVEDTTLFGGNFRKEFTMRATISRKHRFYAGKFARDPELE
jgi:4-amino-4-deoxy-L-arabinose transferase-like glycosyltransferase